MTMSKDFIISLLTTIIGSGFLSFLVFIARSHLILAIVLGVVLVVAIVLIINYQHPLQLMFKSPGNYQVSGDWKTTWSYNKEEGNVDIIVTLNLKQIGQYIRGKAQSIAVRGPAPFDSLQYKLEGRMNPDGIMVGEWKNLNVGMNYYGTFQAKVEAHGREINGVWIGRDSEGVRHGTFQSKKS